MLNRVQSGNLDGPEPVVTRRGAGFPAPAVSSSGTTSARPRRTVIFGKGLDGGDEALDEPVRDEGRRVGVREEVVEQRLGLVRRVGRRRPAKPAGWSPV